RATTDKGYVQMEPAFGYFGETVFKAANGELARLNIAPVNHFAAEMDHLSECVASGKTPGRPGEEGLRDMIVVERIHESMREGGGYVLHEQHVDVLLPWGADHAVAGPGELGDRELRVSDVGGRGQPSAGEWE